MRQWIAWVLFLALTAGASAQRRSIPEMRNLVIAELDAYEGLLEQVSQDLVEAFTQGFKPCMLWPSRLDNQRSLAFTQGPFSQP